MGNNCQGSPKLSLYFFFRCVRHRKYPQEAERLLDRWDIKQAFTNRSTLAQEPDKCIHLKHGRKQRASQRLTRHGQGHARGWCMELKCPYEEVVEQIVEASSDKKPGLDSDLEVLIEVRNKTTVSCCSLLS